MSSSSVDRRQSRSRSTREPPAATLRAEAQTPGGYRGAGLETLQASARRHEFARSDLDDAATSVTNPGTCDTSSARCGDAGEGLRTSRAGCDRGLGVSRTITRAPSNPRSNGVRYRGRACTAAWSFTCLRRPPCRARQASRARPSERSEVAEDPPNEPRMRRRVHLGPRLEPRRSAAAASRCTEQRSSFSYPDRPETGLGRGRKSAASHRADVVDTTSTAAVVIHYGQPTRFEDAPVLSSASRHRVGHSAANRGGRHGA